MPCQHGAETDANAPRTGSVMTDDGVRLHYLEAGAGPDLLLVPGWSLTAELWCHQIAEFSRTHHVVAVDHRGQGRSEKPPYGYRVARLAADMRDVIGALDLSDITWIGHSMGSAVSWAYWELFRGHRLRRMVVIDQPAVVAAPPHWPDGLAEKLGVIFRVGDFADLTSRLAGPDAEAATAAVIASLATPLLPDADRAWIVEQSMLMPREAARALVFDNGVQDWRGLLPRISVPALVIGGDASLFPASAMQEVAALIPSSTLRILSAEERGSHLSFYENPPVVNGAIRSFLRESA
ncbi:alpha/beta hydrolase [Streptomyces sp. NPDC006923]|uniref:alpha/beta fold hydrolase n=1 Tax=Streptomyces sp. NPDC006923 TaxID=3155355 RepID=UPI0033FB94FE